MTGATSHVEHPDLAGWCRKLGEQHVAVPLLGDAEVPELQLEIRIPKSIMKILDVPELLRKDETEFATVHGRES